MDDFPDHAATVLHDNLGPVAITDGFAWLADGWRFALWWWWWWRRAAFRWQSRVNGPDDLAARILVNDFDDVAIQVFVSDLSLNAKLFDWLRGVAGLGSFFGDFVADGPRALTDDLLLVVIGLRRYSDESPALFVRPS